MSSSRKLTGVVNTATGMIGDLPFKRLAELSGSTTAMVRKIAKTLNGKSMDFLRKLLKTDPLRKNADKLLKLEMASMFAKRAGSVKNTVKKIGKKCTSNAALCAGVGIAGYLGYTSYKELSEEKKQCNAMCMPDDWEAFKNDQIDNPTYKTESAVSPHDPTLKYSILYPEFKETLCTRSNLMEDGIRPNEKDSCDKFCQNVCDFELTDVIAKTAKTAAEIATEAAKEGTSALFSELGDFTKYFWIIGGVFILLVVLSLVVKFM
jgi:hypothetical protein